MKTAPCRRTHFPERPPFLTPRPRRAAAESSPKRLKGTIIGSGALIAGAAHAKPEPKGKPKPETYDVVVVGAGFAGMCAALEAAEKGAKTVLLEKMGRPDGTTVYSSGWIAAVGSRFQKNHPEDSKEAFFNDMMKLSGYHSDPELVKVYADEAGDGIDWLADHGTPFFLWENLPAPELSRCVISPGEGISGGSKLLRCLMAALDKAGVKIHYNTKAVHLIKNDKWEVEGVECLTPEALPRQGRRDSDHRRLRRERSDGRAVHRCVGREADRARLALDHG